MEEFKAILIEGVFNDGWPDTLVHPSVGKAVSLITEMSPLVGQRIRLAMHHLPPDMKNLDSGKWGGGSCLWQPSMCPAGHHKRPNYLLNVTGEGVLRFDRRDGAHGWSMDCDDGTRLKLPVPWMSGHYGRLAAATVFDVEKMKDSLSPEDLAAVAGLGGQIDSVRELLEAMRKG